MECVENPEDNLDTLSERKYSAWLAVFKDQRRVVEQAIFELRPETVRKDLLISAKIAVPEIHSSDLTTLEKVAEGLENKLRDLFRVLHGNLKPETLGITIPDDLSGVRIPDSLLSLTSKDERSWLFVGGALEILHHYRNGPGALVVAKRNKLLTQLAESVDVIERRLQSLNRYLIVEQSFNIEEQSWIIDRISEHKRIGQQIVDRYTQVLTSTGSHGINAILEKNFFEVRNQFLQAFLELALRTYGHVTKPALEAVLQLKMIGTFNLDSRAESSDGSPEADRARIKRVRQRAIGKILVRAEAEGWPLLPILKLFNHNQGYGGRRSAKRASRPADDGIASAILHPTE